MVVVWIAAAVLAATALGATIAPTEKHTLEKSSCGRVWVTIHSPAIRLAGGGEILDAIELNWDFADCHHAPGQIGLFDREPGAWNDALVFFPITSQQGRIVTKTSLGASTLPAGWNTGAGVRGPHCLWPWVGAGNSGGNDEIKAYNCLKIQPTWMEDNAAMINNLRIGQLVLPGAHNAGAWSFDTEISTVTRDNFVLCQDRSIWAQLVHGIRYLDFRIGYYEFYTDKNERYWLNHNLIRVRPLMPLLKEIRAFLEATNEIVFLDAHHFPVGFYEQDGSPIRSVHAGLLELVMRELGPHIAHAEQLTTGPGTRGPTVQALLKANKRLLFSYVDHSVVTDNKWLWPILPHLWANTNSPTLLFAYLDDAIPASPQPHALSPLFSAMAQTTPTVLDILLLRGSLRANAEAVNKIVTSRLGDQWRRHANIVSTDFFLGNDVIHLAIALSSERGARL